EQWFTASELAGLPGMPGTDRGIRDWGRRGVIQGRKRSKGKGQEYALSSLPLETRTHLALQTDEHARAGAEDGRRLAMQQEAKQRQSWQAGQKGLADTVAMSDREQARVDARVAVLNAVKRLRRVGWGSRKAVDEVVRQYNEGELAVDDEVREVLGPDISVASVYRWRKKLEQQGVASLAGSYERCGIQARIDQQEEVLRFAEAFVGHNPDCAGPQLRKAILARFRERDDLLMPSLRAVQRWLKTYRQQNAEILTRLRNPDEWKSKYMAASGSASEGIERLNQVWELDSTPGDIMLAEGRFHLVGVIDVATRRARLLVTKTSCSEAIAYLTRRVLLEWGVPEIAKTDNGSDYVSKRMQRVFMQLGVEQETCAPFNPWEKPHVERFFRTFQHDLVELLPSFLGHNVAERQAIEERVAFADRLFSKGESVEATKLTAAEFQRFCDEWTDRIYHQQSHGGLGGRTPLEAAAAAPGTPRMIEDERALDVLLAEAPGDGMRTVTKKGIRLDHGLYDAPELGEVRGQQVHVRYDETDYGRIYVYHQGEFLCVAEDPTVQGVSRKEVAGEVKRRQRVQISEANKRMKDLIRQERPHDAAQEILQAATTHDSVTEFPRPTTTHTTSDLEAARDAADARESMDREPEPAPVDEAAIARVTQMVREDQEQDETAEDRFRRWVGMHERAEAGEQLSEFEIEWMRRYEDTSECRSRKMIYEEMPEMFRAK
ncbi:MAG: Mu transposase C-terminal domain-containing protein, partial [Thiohalospira sp.]